jgi:hypothetical protein
VIPAIKAGIALLGGSSKWMKIISMSLNNNEVRKIEKILIDLNLLKSK